MFVGIDVSKDRLDVHVRPGGEAFAVARDDKGLEELCGRLVGLSPRLVVLEATGGFEVTVAAALARGGFAFGGGQSRPSASLCAGDRAVG